ncbi:MAG TPA: TonB family protein [Puia sp.]|jgi:protein TonB
MESNKILQADILDILFEGRNKEYGAYDLRKTYNRRLYKAIAVMGTVILLIFVGGIVSGRGTKKVANLVYVDTVQLAKAPDDVPPPPPPPPPRVIVPPVATRIFTPPAVVPDEQVKPDEKPPEQAELDNVRIGTVNKDGGDDMGVVAPPASEGVAKGIVEAPKKEADDVIFTTVEIESTYPTGAEGWLRFLNRNLHYPDDAQNNEISGVVMVQFIVDEKGNVSNVQAVSGPESGGLREEAVRVIKKSGLWTAAIQNGRQVKSYKRQPITFRIGDGN